jgi:hypothetical protein
VDWYKLVGWCKRDYPPPPAQAHFPEKAPRGAGAPPAPAPRWYPKPITRANNRPRARPPPPPPRPAARGRLAPCALGLGVARMAHGTDWPWGSVVRF